MDIKLVKNGVFPILFDKDGKTINTAPNTGYMSSGTFQGEGKLLGLPSMFIRLSGCNLRCSWMAWDGSLSICDTPYSSHHVNDFDVWGIDDVIKTVKNNLSGIKHVIISGGEPTLQAEPLAELTARLKDLDLHITLETNGTIFSESFVNFIDLISISPKLSNSVPDQNKIRLMANPIHEKYFVQQEKLRRNIDAIQKYIDSCYQVPQNNTLTKQWIRRNDKDFQLKFVVGRTEDEIEIKKDFLSQLKGVDNNDILLMPLGGTRDFLKKTFNLTAGMAIRNRWRFTPRLHIDLFNDTQWV